MIENFVKDLSEKTNESTAKIIGDNLKKIESFLITMCDRIVEIEKRQGIIHVEQTKGPTA